MPQQTIGIHQFHSGSAPADAATDSMLFVRSILKSWGVASEIFAEHTDPRLKDVIRPLDRLAPARDDLLLIHHSIGHDALPALAKLDCRKALVHHDIAPPRFFTEDDPFHDYGLKGYAQLGELRQMVEAAIALSPFNARQLCQRGFTNVVAIPLLKDFAALRSAPHAKKPYYDEWPVFRILHVGRLVPHKCQHELIEFVGATRAIDGVPLELVLIGDAEIDPDYTRRIEGRVRRLGLEQRVRIAGDIGDEELFGRYRAATVYLSLSEHEGFGVPLIEAMAFDLPVLAYPSPGVAEILSGAGMTLADKRPATIRDSLLRLHRDRPFRRDLIRRQRQNLLRFGRERIEDELARWLRGLGVDVGTGRRADGEAPPGDANCPRVHYVLEGPFETSYSLASVVRNLAASLDARAGCAGTIEPAEGDEGWSVDAAAAERLPKMFRDLVHPPPLTAEPIVTIRNMFPLRPNGMLGDLRLVHLAWEESAIAPDLAAMMNFHLDGVLAPSEYCKELIRSSGVRLPIAVIGHGLDHSGLAPPAPIDRTVRGRPSPEAPFVFLHISAGVDRKGVEELVTAYCLAFSNRDPVVLVIKTFDNEQNLTDFWVNRLIEKAAAAPVIQIIKEELHPQEIELLYRLADAVVLPTRGEGFNFPAAEGLARGLPVIVTRHSGHMDFCSDENSLLVDCLYERSTSHLHIPNSVWARASLPHLIAAMKTAYNEARTRGTPTHLRTLRAPRQVSDLRWGAVAERVDAFARWLGTRPVVTRRLKLAWISSYNSRCGIATYSQYLIEHFDPDLFDITILAADEPPLGPDPEHVHRSWRPRDGNLAQLCHRLLAGGFDAAFFQHDFGLFETTGFAVVLESLQQAGLDTYVTLHQRMGDPGASRRTRLLQQIAAALKGCTRIFVHSVDDMNRLKECGVTNNLVLLPHGVPDRPPLSASAVRVLLGLERCEPVIGSFGFLLPYEGLQNLVHGFALLLRRHPSALLLMVNAECPEDALQAERERCHALIDQLGIAAQVRLVTEFLDTEEIAFLLSACDAVVYPYRESSDAASGAVRLALAAGRPVAITPLPIFSDLSEIVYRLPGTDAAEIAEGLAALLADEGTRGALAKRQRQWVAVNSWAAQAERLANIVRGSFEERHGVALRAPAPAPPPSAASRSRRPKAEDGMLRAEDLAAAEALLKRRPQIPGAGIPESCRAPPQRIAAPDFRPVPSDGIGSRLPGPFRRHMQRRMVRRARRARKAQDWVLAALHYRLALRYAPGRAGLWVQYGHALKESGNFSAAEEAYRRAIAIAPAVADTRLQLGHVLKLQGRPGAAAAAYLQALAVDAQFAPALAELDAFGWSASRIERALSRARTGGP
jgi:glycosyltransferase involved in cell wall biosynthesis